MAVSFETTENLHIVRLEGDFDAASADAARETFAKLAESDSKNVQLDLSEVDFLDSSGIGAIVFLYKRLRCSNRELHLIGVKAQPFDLIRLLRLDEIIETRRKEA